MSRAKQINATNVKNFQTTLQGVFCGKTVTQNALSKFCDLSKNFLCNFDPYAYHYGLISTVKSIDFT